MDFLSPDAEEAGCRYNALRQMLVRFFMLRGVSEPDAAADDTIDRAADKIADGALVPEINRYCRGIGRNIVKERNRKDYREHDAHRKFIDDLKNNSDEEVERIYQFLKPCFDQLMKNDRELLIAYCEVTRGRARAEHRRQLAKKRKTTLLGLRMKVTRLRANLEECVKRLEHEI